MKNLKLLTICLVLISSATFAQKKSITKTASPVYCGNAFNYTATSKVANVTFSWTRAAITGISNPASTGSSATINETLVNTTTNPITVKYAVTMTPSTGCPHVDTLAVVINVPPVLSSVLTTTMCDSTTFNYTATSSQSGATYTWTRAAVTGIDQAASSGTSGTISEILSNNTSADVNVNYIITTSANGCSSTQTLTVTVHPTPFLAFNKARNKINYKTELFSNPVGFFKYIG